ncbi:hypothetical protein CI610_03446 [invertebrate metagenome]|uniref:Uncharacterized protein n=1 Tax=invertebrate metagenome TaxID=1711999 RepID=A0A2H9T318_9ZZZZ
MNSRIFHILYFIVLGLPIGYLFSQETLEPDHLHLILVDDLQQKQMKESVKTTNKQRTLSCYSIPKEKSDSYSLVLPMDTELENIKTDDIYSPSGKDFPIMTWEKGFSQQNYRKGKLTVLLPTGQTKDYSGFILKDENGTEVKAIEIVQRQAGHIHKEHTYPPEGSLLTFDFPDNNRTHHLHKLPLLSLSEPICEADTLDNKPHKPTLCVPIETALYTVQSAYCFRPDPDRNDDIIRGKLSLRYTIQAPNNVSFLPSPIKTIRVIHQPCTNHSDITKQVHDTEQTQCSFDPQLSDKYSCSFSTCRIQGKKRAVTACIQIPDCIPMLHENSQHRINACSSTVEIQPFNVCYLTLFGSPNLSTQEFNVVICDEASSPFKEVFPDALIEVKMNDENIQNAVLLDRHTEKHQRKVRIQSAKQDPEIGYKLTTYADVETLCIMSTSPRPKELVLRHSHRFSAVIQLQKKQNEHTFSSLNGGAVTLTTEKVGNFFEASLSIPAETVYQIHFNKFKQVQARICSDYNTVNAHEFRGFIPPSSHPQEPQSGGLFGAAPVAFFGAAPASSDFSHTSSNLSSKPVPSLTNVTHTDEFDDLKNMMMTCGKREDSDDEDSSSSDQEK